MPPRPSCPRIRYFPTFSRITKPASSLRSSERNCLPMHLLAQTASQVYSNLSDDEGLYRAPSGGRIQTGVAGLALTLRISRTAFLEPVLPHLRQAFHVDGRALALFLAAHRTEQVERLGQILLDGLLRRREVQAPDLRDLVVV